MQAGDRPEQGRFPGPIGTDEGYDLPLFHAQIDTPQHLDVAVSGGDVLDRQQAYGASAPYRAANLDPR